MKYFHPYRPAPWLSKCSQSRIKSPSSIAPKPILDSRKLLAFSTLARVGSFTLAAHELCLTQSAVSHAIKSLEQDLECRLFERHGRRVSLTAAGLQLLHRAHKILDEMSNARADLTALRKIAIRL